ncbi:MAG: transketolase [Vitreoscilla sp.]|nr:transketolase [Burkholderiales bacterium]MBP6337795.1 transketolase [Vitreoscilla sp.]MBP6674443.1 transketolase [Vitreoscilla sp.]
MASNSTDAVIRPDNGKSNVLANALRALAMDAVQQANSGHPGAPMGMAEMAVALWTRHLKHNPANPQWWDRDRFVLSNGHASMLLYSLLNLTGYALPMDELKRFRQRGSLTPGHPEVDHTPGVETTTGPLGQGLTNAVGMALAEKLMGDEFNRPGHTVVDHRTWVFLGDGCLMEGVSQEAISLAGVWRLGKLTALYDDNGISIDGAVTSWFADNTAQRFAASGWNVVGPVDGHDVDAIDAAITQAKASTDQPTLVICRTTIGKGSPARAGTAKAHGEPLGKDEIAATRAALGWSAAPFELPADVAAAWNAKGKGADMEGAWRSEWAAYRKLHAADAVELERRMGGQLPAGFETALLTTLAEVQQKAETVASRKASQKAIAILAPQLPELLGGSADLTGSNLTDWPGCGAVRGGEKGGRHINYGVREFGMAAIMNGIALHGGFIPFGGTFMTFSDYSRNAIRMAALMKRRVIHVFTHDSIGLGEDGPTHQPVEHAASLRLIPDLDVWRPCDEAETLTAWGSAVMNAHGPSALLLSRQNLPAQARSPEQTAAIWRGGYVLSDRPQAKAVIIATGSEVGLAMQAQALLDAQGVAVRVVSMPSTSVFDRQDATYRQGVLLSGLPCVAVEAGSTKLWGAYGCTAVLGIDRFGESAPGPELMKAFGFTPENLAQIVATEAKGFAGEGERQFPRSSN